MKTKARKAYRAAMADKAYQKFRHMVFSSDWYDDKEKFNKAAWYSISPMYRNESDVERAIRLDRMKKLDGCY